MENHDVSMRARPCNKGTIFMSDDRGQAKHVWGHGLCGNSNYLSRFCCKPRSTLKYKCFEKQTTLKLKSLSDLTEIHRWRIEAVCLTPLSVFNLYNLYPGRWVWLHHDLKRKKYKQESGIWSRRWAESLTSVKTHTVLGERAHFSVLTHYLVFLPRKKWNNTFFRKYCEHDSTPHCFTKGQARQCVWPRLFLPVCSQCSLSFFKNLSQQPNSRLFSPLAFSSLSKRPHSSFNPVAHYWNRNDAAKTLRHPDLLTSEQHLVFARFSGLRTCPPRNTWFPSSQSLFCHSHSSLLPLPIRCSLLLNLITESYYGNYWLLWMS